MVPTSVNPKSGIGSIVVATDFSDAAHAALERAFRLPLRLGATVEIVHVVPDTVETSTTEAIEAVAKQHLETLRREARDALAAEHESLDVFATIAHGKPFVEIVRNARNGRAEIIVVGRHGRRSFRDMLIGSTAERVIRKGDVSVLVVGGPPKEDYRHALVGIDLSESSRFALEQTLRLCGPALETLDVVHVLAAPYMAQATDLGIAPELERFRLQEEQHARAALTDFLDDFPRGVPGEVIVKIGDAREVLLEEAKRRGADFIALGTRGRSGIPHMLLGSVAEGVLRAAPCDVLVARLTTGHFQLP